MFHILQCGYRFVHREPLRIDRAGLPFYVFVHYRTEAEAELGGSFVPVQGSWILFPPGEPHRYRSCALPYENDWVHFTSPQGTEFFREHRWYSVIYAPCEFSQGVYFFTGIRRARKAEVT